MKESPTESTFKFNGGGGDCSDVGASSMLNCESKTLAASKGSLRRFAKNDAAICAARVCAMLSRPLFKRRRQNATTARMPTPPRRARAPPRSKKTRTARAKPCTTAGRKHSRCITDLGHCRLSAELNRVFRPASWPNSAGLHKPDTCRWKHLPTSSSPLRRLGGNDQPSKNKSRRYAASGRSIAAGRVELDEWQRHRALSAAARRRAEFRIRRPLGSKSITRSPPARFRHSPVAPSMKPQREGLPVCDLPRGERHIVRVLENRAGARKLLLRNPSRPRAVKGENDVGCPTAADCL